MWKLDESYTNEEKNNFIHEFSSKLLSLDGKITELKAISVNSNSSEAPAANYDLVLDTTFDSISGLKAYAIHPEHVQVVEFAKQYKMQRSCVDYEF